MSEGPKCSVCGKLATGFVGAYVNVASGSHQLGVAPPMDPRCADHNPYATPPQSVPNPELTEDGFEAWFIKWRESLRLQDRHRIHGFIDSDLRTAWNAATARSEKRVADLKHERDTWKRAHEDVFRDALDLKAENAKLEAALREIADVVNVKPINHWSPHHLKAINQAAAIASRALLESSKGDPAG